MNIFLISLNNFKFLVNCYNNLNYKLIIKIKNIIIIQSPKLFKKKGETE